MTHGTLPADSSDVERYTMRISRLTVDKLGIRLYDKAYSVLAELVANAYDADATKVTIKAPMGRILASLHKGEISDSGYVIEVEDDGIGMTPDEVNEFYLMVGAERRNDPRRGDRSKQFERKVMGRKGVGKLAPFGICHRIEVITSGGSEVDGLDVHGSPNRGYQTAHLIMDGRNILSDDSSDYHPEVGELDGTVQPNTGTLLRLTDFTRRKVPAINTLERQLAQRFGIRSANWEVKLVDSEPRGTEGDGEARVVGEFKIDTMPETRITIGNTTVPQEDSRRRLVTKEDGTVHPKLEAGFELDGEFYEVTGWMAFSKDPYRDDLMAGVRIYCRGKIAAQTNVFNRKAGFTGEHDVRSYLVGEIHADWLDESEDLIQTDRRDILWSHALGVAFENWGQDAVVKIGTASRNPMKEKIWDLFRERTDIEKLVETTFPSREHESVRETAMDLAELVGSHMRRSELDDEDHVKSVVDLSLGFAPHMTLDRKLREASDPEAGPLNVVAKLLRIARIAELSSFGRIADERVKVIHRVEELKDDSGTIEQAFQELIQEAPWLIDPQWSPLTSNQAFSTLKTEFEKFYEQQTGEAISLNDFSDPKKRADFVLASQDGVVQVIEIKKPNHRFTNEEMKRLQTYVDLMRQFLDDPKNEVFKSKFPNFKVTLVCDGIGLTNVYRSAFDGLKDKQTLDHINWRSFLMRTRLMHEDFLREAERQRALVSGGGIE